MPTYKGEVIKNQILIHSAVSTPDATGSNRYIRKGPLYTALVDTGAQKTLISPGAASEVGLISSGTDWIIPVSGKPIRCIKYRIRLDIYLPEETENVFWGKEMDVVELPYQPPNHDVLLGMDFLLGFRLTLYKSRFTLSIPQAE